MKLFRIGEIVRLKSGGPTMTVDSYEHDIGAEMASLLKKEKLLVKCIWFEGDVKKHGSFDEESLEIASKLNE